MLLLRIFVAAVVVAAAAVVVVVAAAVVTATVVVTAVVAVVVFLGCFKPWQYTSCLPGKVCSDGCTCCHTETETTDYTYLTQP